MIQYTHGNLLDSPAHALVNTVNTVGVMGKGIALQFKQAFPHNYRVYEKACKAGEVRIGHMLAVEDQSITTGTKLIINFPTKEHWRSSSQLSYIERGMQALVALIKDRNIESIAIPPLGAGQGGLNWADVKPIINRHLEPLHSTRCYIFEPSTQAPTSQSAKVATLTPGRAMLLHLCYRMDIHGEFLSEFAAEKLVYFLVRCGAGQAFARISFKPHYYGPYSCTVKRVLHALNGTFLHGFDGMDKKPFEMLSLDVAAQQQVIDYLKEALTQQQQIAMANAAELLDGFYDTYALELLASIDYLMLQGKSNLEELLLGLQAWSARKARIFDPEHVSLIHQHLLAHRAKLIAAV